ncbi:MAG: hypothetical protein K0A94_12965 [Desulfuromonadales bacterium]|nr:hypothetical protein [Desulfuromonadales bacterium]
MSQQQIKQTRQYPSAPENSILQHQTAPPARPLGRYCGHVFLYWDPEHFHKVAIAAGKP